jgi:hypothetical protein
MGGGQYILMEKNAAMGAELEWGAASGRQRHPSPRPRRARAARRPRAAHFGARPGAASASKNTEELGPAATRDPPGRSRKPPSVVELHRAAAGEQVPRARQALHGRAREERAAGAGKYKQLNKLINQNNMISNN